jgi:hypothetical protein
MVMKNQLLKPLRVSLQRKKNFLIFSSPAGMSLTKLSLDGNNDVIFKLFPLRVSLVSDIPAGDGNIEKFFLWCNHFVAKAFLKRIPNSSKSEVLLIGHHILLFFLTFSP